MSLIFKPDDFNWRAVWTPEEAASKANRVFTDWLEKQTVVYGSATQLDVVSQPTSADTHTARLVCLKEIKREPCKHVIKQFATSNPLETVKCVACGVELVAEWKPKT